MGKRNRNTSKDYNHNDVRSALLHIKKKEMSVKGASFFFEIPEQILKKLLKANKVKEEKPKHQKSKRKSILTPELEHELVDYAVNMGTQICAAKTKEQQKSLEEDLATKSINLDCFKAPPQVKWLKVFVKRDEDKFPFYMFKVTPSDCTHFISQKSQKITKLDHTKNGISLSESCLQDSGSVSPPYESEYILPHDTEEVDYALESKDVAVLGNMPNCKNYDRVHMKTEVNQQIEEEEPMQKRLIENVKLVLKEELNMEEWMEFDKTKTEVNLKKVEDSEPCNKRIIKEERRGLPTIEYIATEELVVKKDPAILELYESIEMEEDCSKLGMHQQYRNKRERYPSARRKKKKRRVNSKPEAPKTLTKAVVKLQNVEKIKVES